MCIYVYTHIYTFKKHIVWKGFMMEGWTLNLPVKLSKGDLDGNNHRWVGIGSLRKITTVIKYIPCWCCNTKWFILNSVFRVYPHWLDSFVNSVCSLANLITLNNSTGEDLKLWWKFVILPGRASISPQQSQTHLLPAGFPRSQCSEISDYTSWQKHTFLLVSFPSEPQKSSDRRQNHFSLGGAWHGSIAGPQAHSFFFSDF